MEERIGVEALGLRVLRDHPLKLVEVQLEYILKWLHRASYSLAKPLISGQLGGKKSGRFVVALHHRRSHLELHSHVSCCRKLRIGRGRHRGLLDSRRGRRKTAAEEHSIHCGRPVEDGRNVAGRGASGHHDRSSLLQ